MGRLETQPAAATAAAVAARERLKHQKVRDTRPELELRRQLHRMGLRYYIDRPIPGQRARPDLVFPRQRVAVFIDGCFWHGCPSHFALPKTNRAFWSAKIEGNRTRDREVSMLLESQGWEVVRAWSHEDPADVASRVLAAVSPASR